MILWMLKLISSIRRAVAGRKYPSQLAWAVSFGLLLGVVPHGNLLAVAILIVVLSLRVNHAMAGLTAVGVSFLATRLDPFSHQVGQWVLSHPEVQEKAVAAWQLPLVPWTNLNNTVVMGSFLMGVAALLPVFLVTYPIFRILAPRPKRETEATKDRSVDARKSDDGVHQVVLVDPSHQTIAAPHHQPTTVPRSQPDRARQDESGQQATQDDLDFVEIDHEQGGPEEKVAVETRIDVIRMQDHREAQPNTSSLTADPSEDHAQPMDEALNYLLRQLRDSQERKAA